MKGIVVEPSVNIGWGLPFWLGINIEYYGCEGLGHHGVKFCLEFGYIEFMLCIGKRYGG